MAHVISARQTEQVIEETRKRVAFAEQAFGKKFPSVEITMDVKGSAWGYYSRRGKQRQIRYNPQLFAKFFDEGINTTIPHEVAHFVVDTLFHRRSVKPHGKEWREVMAIFGIENARATHSADLNGIDRRQQRRFQYQCDCGPVMLSTTRHFRILRGKMTYSCQRCGIKLYKASTEF